MHQNVVVDLVAVEAEEGEARAEQGQALDQFRIHISDGDVCQVGQVLQQQSGPSK